MIHLEQSAVKIHFIGIGGIGMSGIAEVLIGLGHQISGSDLNPSNNTKKLEKLGAKIFYGHYPENLEGVEIVVFSSAINNENCELKKARALKLPIMKRAEMLADLMRVKQGIAVAGTHGKTTTTSLLATILCGADLSPTYVIGGIVENLKGHAQVGGGQLLVTEADESDGSFLYLSPVMAAITNIDNDHMDYYESEEKQFSAFLTFANSVPFYGICSLNIHDLKLRELIKSIKRPYLTFGIAEEFSKSESEWANKCDYLASKLSLGPGFAEFHLNCLGEDCGVVRINITGKHNVLNALGAISLAHKMGISIEQIKTAITQFSGVGRRMEILKRVGELEVVDDYAHHPTEIMATIEALKASSPDKKLTVVFEPHRFTRTKALWPEFLHCFNGADRVMIGPIYPASERPISGIDSKQLIKDINQVHPGLASYYSDSDELKILCSEFKNQSATLAFLGAGSISRIAKQIVAELF